MTSKSSFYRTWFVFKDTLKHSTWVVAAWSVALLFIAVIYPVTTLNLNSNETMRVYNSISWMNSSFNIFLTLTLFAGIIFAIVAAGRFDYLSKRTELDFYHAQPVKRKELFFGKYLSGLTVILAPLFVFFIFMLGLFNAFSTKGTISKELFPGGIFYENAGNENIRLVIPYDKLFTMLGLIMLIIIIAYTVFVFSRILCGNNIASYLIAACTVILPYFTADAIYSLGSYQRAAGYIYTGSPGFFYYMNPMNLLDISSIYDSSYIFNKQLKIIFIWLGSAALLFIASLLLCKNRKSEAAGKMISFKWAADIFTVVIVMFFTLLGVYVYISSTETYTETFTLVRGILLSGVLFGGGVYFGAGAMNGYARLLDKKRLAVAAAAIVLTVSLSMLLIFNSPFVEIPKAMV